MIPFNDGTIADPADYPIGTKVTLDGVCTEHVYTVDEEIVGIAFNDDGGIEDLILNRETSMAMANEGRRILVLRGDGHLDKEELQDSVDNELRAYADCFGTNLPE